MHLTADEMLALVNSLYWPFVRFSALFVVAPIFGARNFPVQARVLLALALAFMVRPFVEIPAGINAFSASGMLVTTTQVFIGLTMGIILQMVFAAVVIAGQTIATSMGLGFAATVDPQNGVQVPVVSQYLLILATLIFLSLDGHLILIETLVKSFELFPVGLQPWPENLPGHVMNWISHIFSGALLLALPSVATILLVNIAFGVMTRTAPQINVFSVGFPITIIVGFIMILISLPTIIPLLQGLLEDSFALSLTVLG